MRPAVWQALHAMPVIPSVWDEEGLKKIARIQVAVMYLQFGSLFTLPDMCQRIKSMRPDTAIFFHIDLAEGIAADEVGVQFVKQCGIDGIVTTKPSLIESAKKAGLMAVLRAFIQDSRSLRRAVQLSQRCGPDALDILPGPVIPEVISDLKSSLTQPIIAGGLIRRENQVRELLKAGCRGVGTSSPVLWALNGRITVS